MSPPDEEEAASGLSAASQRLPSREEGADGESTADLPDCEPCAHAREHGWWGSTIPPNATHCRDCHANFPGSNRWGHCARCHQTFSGVRTFDLHQRHDVDGEYTAECLCSLSAVPERTNQPRLTSYLVGNAETLTWCIAEWGDYWRREAPDFGVGP